VTRASLPVPPSHEPGTPPISAAHSPLCLARYRRLKKKSPLTGSKFDRTAGSFVISAPCTCAQRSDWLLQVRLQVYRGHHRIGRLRCVLVSTGDARSAFSIRSWAQAKSWICPAVSIRLAGYDPSRPKDPSLDRFALGCSRLAIGGTSAAPS
jgi:hypothetical protein